MKIAQLLKEKLDKQKSKSVFRLTKKKKVQRQYIVDIMHNDEQTGLY